MANPPGRGLTLKALLIGTLGMATACAMAIHAFAYLRTGTLAGDWFPPAAGIAFLVILFGLNPLLRLIHRRLELDRAELLLVFAMIFIAAPLSETGFAAMFLTNIMSPFFFATGGNQWWTKLAQHLPAWLYPSDARAIAWYWDGLPPNQSIPWGAWVSPLAYWTVIFAAFYGLMTSMTVLLRKQWADNERLIFPLMEAPALLLEEYETGRRLPPVMRAPLFWVGMGLSGVVFGTQILNGIDPAFPAIRMLGRNVIVLRAAETWTELPLHLLPIVVAFGYLIKLDVLLSIWLFGFLAYFQQNIMNSLGYSSGVSLAWEGQGTPAMAWQAFGALVVFVLSGLYMARAHLKGIGRKLLFNDPAVDDSAELMSYRKSGAVFAISIATLLVFLTQMGLTLPIAALLLFATIVTYLALTRFVIEGGLVLCRSTVPAVFVPVVIFGAQSMPIASLAGLATCAAFINCDPKAGYMPAFANVLKLSEGENLRRGTLLKTTVYALVFGSAFCLWFTMDFCYHLGAANAQGPNLVGGGRGFFNSTVAAINNVAEPDTRRLMWGGVGMALMGVLTVGRYSFAWWPIHPIGLPVGNSWGVQMGLFSIFVAWCAKSIILRVGGVALYTRAKPFFIGLLIGHLAAMGVSYVCDIFKGPPGLNLYI